MNWKRAFLSLALGGAVLLGAAEMAQAHDRRLDRIRHEQFKLHRDIRHHGLFSRQVLHRRAKIDRLRRHCDFRGFDHRRDFRPHRGHRRW